MDQHKYSDLKVSVEVDPLTQHIINSDFMLESLSEQPKRKTEQKNVFRMMKRANDGQMRTI